MRSVFLVNTVCLAKQQAESIANMLPFKVSVLCGEVGVDLWDLADWNKVLDENEILVATAQVVLDAIKRSYFKLEQINVIVFDECHHGRKDNIVLGNSSKKNNKINPTGKDHPYHEIMKQINSDHKVRIIGLSGMLIGNDNKIKAVTVPEELLKLESVFLSTIITVNNLDDHKNVLLCSTNAKERLLQFRKPSISQSINEVSRILENLQEMLLKVKLDNYITINPKSLRETTPRKVKDLILLFKDFHYQANEMGPYGGYLSLLSTLIQFELIKRWCDTDAYREIVKVCITTTERCINKMEVEIGLSRSDPSSILKNSSDKVIKLFGILTQMFNDPNREKDLQCLVFVERRSTAKALYHALKAFATTNPNFPIIPDFMVGINNEMPESIEAILNHNYNSIALEKFKNNETNLIVASSVLEEGIDLQMCNLVVMYDTPKVYRSYVQARGRARVDNSHYVVLVDSEAVGKFQQKVIIWRDVDKELKKQLLYKTFDRDAPSEEDIQKERMDCWEPFVTPISKSVLNNCNAVR
jgi:endoribonuclease Dicer